MFGRLLRNKRLHSGAGEGGTDAPFVDLSRTPKGVAYRTAGVDLSQYPGADASLSAGDVLGAVAAVRAVRSDLSDAESARIELQFRHEAFRRTRDSLTRSPAPRPDSPAAAPAGLKEVQAADLSLADLVAGVRGEGALVVRGLLPALACTNLRERIDAGLAAFERSGGEPDDRWHVPLADLAGQPLSPVYRANGYQVFDGQVSVADTPLAASYILQQFENLGLPALVAEYLGIRPALSLEKWTLRRVPPTTNSSWHQDGAFLGEGVGTLNLWIALSDCGESASGLDIVAKRFDRIVPTGTEGAYFDWDVSPAEVETSRGSSPVVSPVFQPGDAVFFDHFLLHRTGLAPHMTHDRYALESWFFDPQRFPERYAGLLV